MKYRWNVSLFIFFFAVSCLALTSCSGSSSAQTDPQADYNAAVQDAKTMTAAKISKNLTAIVPENANLIWESNVPGTRDKTGHSAKAECRYNRRHQDIQTLHGISRQMGRRSF